MTSKSNITLAKSGFYSKLVLDYVQGNSELAKFYKYPYSIESFAEAIKSKVTSSEQRMLLQRVIINQYSKNHIDFSSEKQLNKNIQSLSQSNTFTVTTGHQICIATGPLYFIVKIVHAIKLAEELTKRHPEFNIVPIFWMATEDHDFDEIKSVEINGKKISWDIQSNAQPVGRIKTDGIASFFDEMGVQLTNDELIKKWKSIYMDAPNLADATHRLVHELFGKSGLVILNADDHELKKSFTSVIKKDVMDQEIYRSLNESNEALSKKYKLQVNGRAINHFYIHGASRRLIEQKGDTFSIKDSNLQFTRDEMLSEIENYPDRFSPNVVLRPVYQECILPNIAYIGGPGEIAYWLQLKSVFDLVQLNFPILVCRNSFLFISQESNRKLKKLKLAHEDLFTKQSALEKSVLEKLAPSSHGQLIDTLSNTYQQLINEVEVIDNKLSSTILADKLKQLEHLQQLSKRINQAKKQKYEVQLEWLKEVLNDTYPGGNPNERVNNVLHFTEHPNELIDLLYSNSDMLPSYVQVIVY